MENSRSLEPDLTQPHCINLSRRWKVVCVREDESVPTWIDLAGLNVDDGALAAQGSQSPIKLARQFNCPSNLSDNTRVSLVLQEFPAGSKAKLNEAKLCFENSSGNDTLLVVDISEFIQPHNQLEVEFIAQETNSLAARLEIIASD